MSISPFSSLQITLSLTPSIPPQSPIMQVPTPDHDAFSSTDQTLSKKTIYFAYGSNLWLQQMRTRCPTSAFLGVARLRGYRWFIYERGYANIVEVEDDQEEGKGVDENKKHDYANEVWGLVYSLEKEDERRLDINEGVPRAYWKEWIECEYWPAREDEGEGGENIDSGKGKADLSKKPKEVEMLVYINRDLTNEGKIWEEYIDRMNKGIEDAVMEGVPKEYVEQVLREWVPKEDHDDDEEWEKEMEALRKLKGGRRS